MANVFATRTGNWSNTAIWNTSALPTTVDDVWSNNFIVYVDGDFQVLSIRNKATTGINAGGGFILNNGASLSANVEGSGATGIANACVRFLSAAPSTATLVGNLSTNNSAIAHPVALNHGGTGTLTVYGSCLGGTNAAGSLFSGYVYLGSSGTLNIFGDVRGGSGAGFYYAGIDVASSGTVNVVGNILPGISTTTPNGLWGILKNSTGTINVTGNLIGSNIDNNTQTINVRSGGGSINIIGNLTAGTGSYSIPLFIASTVGSSTLSINISGNIRSGGNFQGFGTSLEGGILTVNINGDVFAGTGGGTHGINNLTNSVISITGNTVGGIGSTAYGILHNPSTGRVTILGNVIGGAGSLAYGAFNNATGYMEVNGIAIGNGWGLGSSGIGGAAPGIFGSQTGTTIIRGLSCGPRGQWPTAGVVRIQPQSTSTATLFTSASAAQVLFTSLSTNIVPPASSVRLGTVYNLNQSTGTCAMPSISSVLQGVAVDNSVGIAALQPQTIWNYSVLSATDVNSLGGRLKEVATVQSVGQQLTALN